MAKNMWKRRAGWRDREFYPWIAAASATMIGTAAIAGICSLSRNLYAVAGVGFKILVGALGVTLLGFEWLVAMLTQPRKDDMDDYDYDNFFVNMLDGS
eukprot:Skav217464  [mRNA]  locus=scaffold1405:101225:101755:+ [translate_table: standard]